MKDYSLNDDERKQYILSYKIEDEKIIAKLASRESYIIPYTKENEQLVIAKMEKQARKAKVKPLSLTEKILAVSQPLILPVAIFNFISNGGWFLVYCF